MRSATTSYIVRVYRRGRRAHELSGMVEIPSRGTRQAFHGLDELMAILRGARGSTKNGPRS